MEVQKCHDEIVFVDKVAAELLAGNLSKQACSHRNLQNT